MNHTLLVCVVKCFSDLDAQFSGFAAAQSSLSQPLVQRFSFDEIADNEDRVVFHAHFVNADDVWMLKLGRSTGLAQELFGLFAPDVAAPRDLDGDNTIKLRIACFPYRPETADTKAFGQLEVTNPSSTLGFGARSRLVVKRLVNGQRELAAA